MFVAARRAESSSPRIRWVLRGLWLTLPFAAGPGLAVALRPAEPGLRTCASVGLWAGWGIGVIATLVPHPLGLTALRVLAPASVAAALASVLGPGSGHLGGHRSEAELGVTLVWTMVTSAVVLAPATASWCVNGPAYPNERRYPLRTPGPLLLGPLLAAWVLTVVGIASGPLLLATGHWLGGALALAAGLPVASVLVRSLHALSERWAVFVPAGLVLHDPLALVDPVLFRRQLVTALGPAPAEGLDRSVDLTQRAPGLALELRLSEAVDLLLARPGNRLGLTERATRLLFTPARPGAVLSEARARRLPVG